MTIISWDENKFLLGVQFMDDTHKEFVTLLNQLADCADDKFANRFNALISHTISHFQQEETQMNESRFPAYVEHRDEHQRILGEFMQFKKRVDTGSVVFARNYIRSKMPGWFSLHAATMDSALAAHLKSRIQEKTGNSTL